MKDNVLNLDGVDFEIVFDNEVTGLNSITNADDDRILCSATKENLYEVRIIITN